MSSKSILKISLFLNILLFFILLFFIFQTQLFRFHSVQKIPLEIEKELEILGAKALISEDVPVGALIIYKEKIIGRGFNTVIRDDNIAGHAEINAINDVISNMGYEAFQEMDKSQLEIISTYEPCEMCKGTLVHYRINNVKFLKEKSITRWIKNNAAGLFYEIDKRQAGNEKVQDSLFQLHPQYPGNE